MRYIWLLVVIIVGVVSAIHAEKEGPKVVADEVLFEQSVGDAGRKLAIVRGPDRDPSLVNFLQDDPESPGLRVERIHNMYEVRAELRTPDSQPLLLASRLRIENKLIDVDQSIVVLDSLVEPGNIVLATADGLYFALWQINSGMGTCWAPLRADKPWSLSAAPYRLDHESVTLELGRTADGRLTLKVIENDTRHHTIYEEVEKGSLRFKAVRQWVEARGQ